MVALPLQVAQADDFGDSDFAGYQAHRLTSDNCCHSDTSWYEYFVDVAFIHVFNTYIDKYTIHTHRQYIHKILVYCIQAFSASWISLNKILCQSSAMRRDQTSGKRSMLEQRWTQCLHDCEHLWTCIAFARVDFRTRPRPWSSESLESWIITYYKATTWNERPGSSVGSSAQRVSCTMSSPLSQFCGHCSPNVGSWECQIFRLRLEDCSNMSKGVKKDMVSCDIHLGFCFQPLGDPLYIAASACLETCTFAPLATTSDLSGLRHWQCTAPCRTQSQTCQFWIW